MTTWIEDLTKRWGPPLCSDCGHSHSPNLAWICIGCPCETTTVVPYETELTDRTRRAWIWQREEPGRGIVTYCLAIETLRAGGYSTELASKPSNGNSAFLAGGTEPDDDMLRALICVMWLGVEAL